MESFPGKEQLHVICSSAFQPFCHPRTLIYFRVCHGITVNQDLKNTNYL